METTNNTNLATFTHLSVLTQYCIPFGNYIFPILIWNSKKSESEFIDFNGKQALNFQLSILLYTLLLTAILIPLVITSFYNVFPTFHDVDEEFIVNHICFEHLQGTTIAAIGIITLFAFLKIVEFLLVIYASVKTSNGENFKYPLSIPFIK